MREKVSDRYRVSCSIDWVRAKIIERDVETYDHFK
jgi:hypothetical protein